MKVGDLVRKVGEWDDPRDYGVGILISENKETDSFEVLWSTGVQVYEHNMWVGKHWLKTTKE